MLQLDLAPCYMLKHHCNIGLKYLTVICKNWLHKSDLTQKFIGVETSVNHIKKDSRFPHIIVYHCISSFEYSNISSDYKIGA